MSKKHPYQSLSKAERSRRFTPKRFRKPTVKSVTDFAAQHVAKFGPAPVFSKELLDRAVVTPTNSGWLNGMLEGVHAAIAKKPELSPRIKRAITGILSLEPNITASKLISQLYSVVSVAEGFDHVDAVEFAGREKYRLTQGLV